MNRKETAKALKEVYDKGYHDGLEDACDLIQPYLTSSIINLIAELKESAKGAKSKVFDMEGEDD